MKICFDIKTVLQNSLRNILAISYLKLLTRDPVQTPIFNTEYLITREK